MNNEMFPAVTPRTSTDALPVRRIIKFAAIATSEITATAISRPGTGNSREGFVMHAG
jgi:hypothetical protein